MHRGNVLNCLYLPDRVGFSVLLAEGGRGLRDSLPCWERDVKERPFVVVFPGDGDGWTLSLKQRRAAEGRIYFTGKAKS